MRVKAFTIGERSLSLAVVRWPHCTARKRLRRLARMLRRKTKSPG